MQNERLWSKEYIYLILSQVMISFGFQMITPVLPLQLYKLGSSEAEIGFVMGSFTISAFIIRPFSYLGIKRAGKKGYLILGIFLCFVATFGYALAESAANVLFVRIFHGLGFGIATTLMATLVADIAPPARRGEGIGIFGLSNTISQSVAPLLALNIAASGNIRNAFFVSATSIAAALIWIKYFFNPRLPQEILSDEDTGGQAKSMIKDPKTLLLGFLTMLVGVCMGGMMNFITLYGQKLSIGNIGYFFLVCTLSIFVTRLVSGRVFDRKGHFWVMVPGSVILFGGMVLLSKAVSLLTILLAALFFGLGVGTLQPSLQAWMMNGVVPEQRSIASAIFFNSYDIGIGGGSFILGIIAERVGYAMMYRYASLAMIIFLSSYLVFVFSNSVERKRIIGIAISSKARTLSKS